MRVAVEKTWGGAVRGHLDVKERGRVAPFSFGVVEKNFGNRSEGGEAWRHTHGIDTRSTRRLLCSISRRKAGSLTALRNTAFHLIAVSESTPRGKTTL